MKFSKLLMITLLASNASLLCMHEDWGIKNPLLGSSSSDAGSIGNLFGDDDEAQPTMMEMEEEDFFPQEESDEEPLLEFRKGFQNLAEKDQSTAWQVLKAHKMMCKVHARGLSNPVAHNVSKAWQGLAKGDCRLPETSPVRELLARHGVRVAQNPDGQKINSFLHPAVLSLFAPELAASITGIARRVHEINAECGVEENPDTENAIVLLAFPLIKKQCEPLFDLQSGLLCALEGTKPYDAHQEAKARTKELRRRMAELHEQMFLPNIRATEGGIAFALEINDDAFLN
jgi:hypothetical protein